MALALKVNPTTYPVYANVLKVIGYDPIEDKARVNGLFVVVTKVTVLNGLVVWKVEHYDERDFRRFFRWGDDGPSWTDFTEVHEVVEEEDEE